MHTSTIKEICGHSDDGRVDRHKELDRRTLAQLALDLVLAVVSDPAIVKLKRLEITSSLDKYDTVESDLSVWSKLHSRSNGPADRR